MSENTERNFMTVLSELPLACRGECPPVEQLMCPEAGRLFELSTASHTPDQVEYAIECLSALTKAVGKKSPAEQGVIVSGMKGIIKRCCVTQHIQWQG